MFSWLLLLCKTLGRAAPRMVYDAARIPRWRRAPPLAHVYVVAVRAAGLESLPRLFQQVPGVRLQACISLYSRNLTRMVRVIANHTRYLFLRKFKDRAIFI